MNLLEKKLKNLPSSSGVYQYFDEQNHLLYIGKAKNLKNRVKSYFRFTPTLAPSSNLSNRISKMIAQVTNLEYIIVPNEHEALILENSLIKQLKPKYNILLRDDKTYPYIYIDYEEEFPRFEITRKIIKKPKIKYFGPYSTGARDLLKSIYDVVPLVQKKGSLKSKKACLFYQIGKCLAPCEGKITQEEYAKQIHYGLELINNKNKLIKILNIRLDKLSSELRFEEAMALRDNIKAIQNSQISSDLDFARLENIDIFYIEEFGKRAVNIKLFIRDGKLISSSHNFIKYSSDEFDIDEAYKRAIFNYYNGDIPVLPSQIIVGYEFDNMDEVSKFLSKKYNKNIEILKPKRGKKKELINIASSNAKELIKIDKYKNDFAVYDEIKELFGLEFVPSRIEVFDNSHMMGEATVGAMVVYEDKFIKSDYRHYNLQAKDEYAQMYETLSRRVESFETNPPPDLWVIDGGKTLMNLAIDILNSVGVNIDVIGISKEKVDAKASRTKLTTTKSSRRAKGGARDIIYSKNKIEDVFRLEMSDKRLQFIQRLRDEAHRFAITYHKKTKLKKDKEISLLKIDGFGEGKVKKLIDYFGTFDAIKNASVSELEMVLSSKDANNLKNSFIDS
jgi:excinuclease ABC subunit C